MASGVVPLSALCPSQFPCTRSPRISSLLSLKQKPKTCNHDGHEEGCQPTSLTLLECSTAEKVKFIQDEWLPLIREMREALMTTAERVLIGWTASESAPSQDQLLEWSHRCFELSRKWHGRPNLSAFYEFFIELTNVMGINAFTMDQIPMVWSEDGYLAITRPSSRGSDAG